MTREHARFEMWRWQYAHGTNFTQMLYDLYDKADQYNKAKLKISFPVEVGAYEEWYRSTDPEKLLEEWKQYGSKDETVHSS